MTDKEIAIKALEKANMYDNFAELSLAFYVNMGGESKDSYIRQIFLSHKFAKAFWGEEWVDDYGNEGEEELMEMAWQYHLQQMVLEKNILKYIKKFLE